MTTFTALTTLTDETAAAALAGRIEDLDPGPIGVGVFEIEDGTGTWEVGAYFTARPDGVALDLLAAAFGARPFAVSKLQDKDWVTHVQRELRPVPAGRFVVHGRHDRGAIPLNRIGLEIEAAMAFGTGHHATTRGCLLALDGFARQGWVARRTADIGCGTGVLAMAARRLWRRRVLAADIDAVAVTAAAVNLRFNRAASRPAICAPGFRHPGFRAEAPYNLVFANILAAPLCRMADQVAAHTRPGARVVLSGILARQARRVEVIYGGHRFRVIRRIPLDGWVTLVLQRH